MGDGRRDQASDAENRSDDEFGGRRDDASLSGMCFVPGNLSRRGRNLKKYITLLHDPFLLLVSPPFLDVIGGALSV